MGFLALWPLSRLWLSWLTWPLWLYGRHGRRDPCVCHDCHSHLIVTIVAVVAVVQMRGLILELHCADCIICIMRIISYGLHCVHYTDCIVQIVLCGLHYADCIMWIASCPPRFSIDLCAPTNVVTLQKRRNWSFEIAWSQAALCSALQREDALYQKSTFSYVAWETSL